MDQTAARHIRNLPCPVTSRISPRAFIQARLRCTAARLARVTVSAIGAEISGHSVSAARNAGGVRPDSGAKTVSARADQASISSRRRVAVRVALSLFAARDHLGVKPVYLFWNGGSLAIASQPRAFYGLPDFAPRIAPDAFLDLLGYGVVPGDLSAYTMGFESARADERSSCATVGAIRTVGHE